MPPAADANNHFVISSIQNEPLTLMGAGHVFTCLDARKMIAKLEFSVYTEKNIEGEIIMLAEIAKMYYLEKGANCSEAIVKAANDAYKLGLDEKAIKLISGFGGGCGCGILCGAVAGALSIVSLLSVGEGGAHATEGFGPLCGGLVEEIKEKLSSTDCKDIKPQMVQPEVRCVRTVEIAAEVLEAYLKEHGKV